MRDRSPKETTDTFLDAAFYRDSGRVPFATKLSKRARMATYVLFTKMCAPSSTTRILDVGVSEENGTEESNMLERLHPWPASMMCAGIHEGTGFCHNFPRHPYVQIQPGEPLPFPDKSFDIAYSNAVLEHVGNDQSQRQFIHELNRVGKRVCIIVPNRWFPIEHHTGIPLVHWLPLSLFRRILAKTHLNYWAKEENLNPLSKRKLASLFPPEVRSKIHYTGVGLGPFKSNLIAFT